MVGRSGWRGGDIGVLYVGCRLVGGAEGGVVCLYTLLPAIGGPVSFR